MSTTEAIRHKLYDYIRVADEQRLQAIFHLVERELESPHEEPKNYGLIQESENQTAAANGPSEESFSLGQLRQTIILMQDKQRNL